MLLALDILVIDEISMLDQMALYFIERSLRNLRGNSENFGGVKVICCGDFRQLLPVKQHEGQVGTIASCCNQTALWQSFKRHELKRNMRVKRNASSSAWKDFLLRVGDGSENDDNGYIMLPAQCKIVKTLPQMVRGLGKKLWTGQNAILASTNRCVDEANKYISDLMDRKLEQRIYTSIDEPDGDTEISPTILHRTEYPGFPKHELHLRKGMIVMVIRNIADDKRNGTRIRITKLGHHSITGNIVNKGPNFGKKTCVFPVKLYSDEKKTGFIFKRTQLPLTISFAMTIHKSQGQTMERVGLYLADHIFAHGQLYVALSRSSEGGTGIISTERKISNIVYPEVLNK